MANVEVKWTPGPWIAKDRLISKDRNGVGDIAVCQGDHGFAAASANACLISAAPDLYAALEADEALIQHAQAILTEYLIPDGMSKDEAISQLLSLLDGPDQRAAANLASAAIAKATGAA